MRLRWQEFYPIQPTSETIFNIFGEEEQDEKKKFYFYDISIHEIITNLDSTVSLLNNYYNYLETLCNFAFLYKIRIDDHRSSNAVRNINKIRGS